MVHNLAMVDQAQGKPKGKMPHNSTLLGWKCMVAPTHKTAVQAGPSGVGQSKVGAVFGLPGPEDATYKVAPSLCDVVRECMERKQIQPEGISLHLKKVGALGYDKAFKTLWAFMKNKNLNPVDSSVEQVAGAILALNECNVNLAKNAYAACLWIPGFEYLRFSPLLRICKKDWNVSVARYQEFWDASPILRKLRDEIVPWDNVELVRNRLIIVMRFLHLMRSVDLARCFRSCSLQGNRLWILIQRKGAKEAKWEEVMRAPPPQGVKPFSLAAAICEVDFLCACWFSIAEGLEAPLCPIDCQFNWENN
jgi:hypothetical protein